MVAVSDDLEKPSYHHCTVILGRNPILLNVTLKRALGFFPPGKWGKEGHVLLVHLAAGAVWFNAMLHGGKLSSICGMNEKTEVLN